MTMQDILTQVASGNLKADEAGKLLSTLGGGSAPRVAKLTVARNKSGGIYIIHPKVKGYSEAKHKEYTATTNFPKGVAESLFGDSAVVAEVAKAVQEFLKAA